MAFTGNNYGSISKASDTSFLWNIPNLIDIIRKGTDYIFQSPTFLFEDCFWYIQAYRHRSEACTVARLNVLKRGNSECRHAYNLSVYDVFGDCYRPLPVSRSTLGDGTISGSVHEQSEFDLLKAVRWRTSRKDLSVRLEFYPEADRLPGIAIIPAESTSSTADCGTQTDPNLQRERCVSSDSAGLEDLGQNLKELLLNGEKSDITFNVKGRDLKAHLNILAARSPVFRAMLNQEQLEQASGTVQITDCDAEVFQDFLIYLYSGKLETLEVRNVVELITLADKYAVKSLAKICVDFMLSNLTADTFCDFVPLSLRHSELKLMASADCNFVEVVKQIIPTEKWKGFVSQHPSEASELVDLCASS